jgi:uncharacterized protein (DUF362 family)
MHNQVFIKEVFGYNTQAIYDCLPDSLFGSILKNSKVVIKPNWVKQSHQSKESDWDYIITHPDVITAVLLKVLEKLDSNGCISILDGPETESSFEKILSRYPAEEWFNLAMKKGINLKIIDLRDDEWIARGNVIVERKKLKGDPRGKTEINLRKFSEFWNKDKPINGYYGADYNIKETNNAHNGVNNIYRLSRSVIEADVFINIPKLKTHKKAGITCCLKNLVGVNTYKNFLPHYTIGSFNEGGDQFPSRSRKNTIESKLLSFIKQHILIYPMFARVVSPIFKPGKKLFGETRDVIRSGNWYGNDTIWRMILDLNKIVFYANPDGTLRADNLINRKAYIGIVDAINCGENEGPKSPDPKHLGYLILGSNPVAIDATASTLMCFDPLKIPMIEKSFQIEKYKLVDFKYSDINVFIGDEIFTLSSIPSKYKKVFEPHIGWKNHIESDENKNQ